MTIWYKQGVCGDLINPMRKCLGRIHDEYNKAFGIDLFVTAIRDGNHMAGSLHYDGAAVDFRKAPGKIMTKEVMRGICGTAFDVVEHDTHFHIEYDPK